MLLEAYLLPETAGSCSSWLGMAMPNTQVITEIFGVVNKPVMELRPREEKAFWEEQQCWAMYYFNTFLLPFLSFPHQACAGPLPTGWKELRSGPWEPWLWICSLRPGTVSYWSSLRGWNTPMAALQQQPLLPVRSQQQPVVLRAWMAAAQPGRGARQGLTRAAAVQERSHLNSSETLHNYFCFLTAPKHRFCNIQVINLYNRVNARFPTYFIILIWIPFHYHRFPEGFVLEGTLMIIS